MEAGGKVVRGGFDMVDIICSNYFGVVRLRDKKYVNYHKLMTGFS